MLADHIPRNVLVTGACGFIGSNYLNYQFGAWPDANFVNLDKLILNSDTQHIDKTVRESSRYKLVLADIKNRAAVLKVLQDNCIDTVVHFAADCTSTRCYENPAEAVENNVIAFIQFLETIRQYGHVEKIVHVSTDEVYGDSELGEKETGKREHSRLVPGNPYAATKIAAEALVRGFQNQYSMPIVMARINNIYGPNQWDVKVVPRFIEIAKARGEFTIQGSGQQLRSWLFVDDAAAGIQAIAEEGKCGEIYNLGTYFEMSVKDLAFAVQHEVDRQLERPYVEPTFKSIPDRPYNDLRYLIDISKASQELGWDPKISFSEGLRRTVESALRPSHSIKLVVGLVGGKGFVGVEMQRALQRRNIPFKLATKKPGFDSDAEVEQELATLGVTHVVCCTGRTCGGGVNTIEYLEGGPDKTFENVRDNMYSATFLAHTCDKLGLHYTYVGTGYIFAYDERHPVGGKGFDEADEPTFFGSSYSVVKGFTDRQLSAFENKEVINARITLPLTFDLSSSRNLLTKIISYKELFDLPVSITILPDCLDALISLMERRFGGTLNLVNPKPISLYEIVLLYKEIVDPNVSPSAIGMDSERGKVLLATKGNCALSTELLERLVSVPSAEESLRKNFSLLKKSLKK